MNFEQELRERHARANEIISEYLPGEQAVPGRLAEAMDYSIRIGGKRIRPILMQESYRMYGGHEAVVEPFMAAIEMIHTHSLIHDDLPALDNDELRRGNRTTHAVFGEAIGILAGDALLNFAYETALQAFGLTKETERVVEGLRILAGKSGLFGMLGGQSVDVENDKDGMCPLDQDELDYIYLHKTAALIEAPLMIGAVLAGAGKDEVSCMEEIGRRIGLAFQIQDDILDVTSTTGQLGKPIDSDRKNDKTTYVTLQGTTQSAKTVQELTKEAVRLLDTLPGEKEFLREMLLRMASRTR
ncbi:MAG: polyprenyl synthetase family protein [Eubacterium sp.]|nr:polyprenyl synthetase family protein [Eubacterium sp.]